MTQVTITITSPAKLLGVVLHHPGNTPPDFVDPTQPFSKNLPDGLYKVAVSGTGMPPNTPVDVEFAASKSKTRGGRVKTDGTIALFKRFILTNGTVS